MRNLILSDRLGVRLVPLRVSGVTAGSVVTMALGTNDYRSVTYDGVGTFTATLKQPFRKAPFLFGSTDSSLPGGYSNFGFAQINSFVGHIYNSAGAGADGTLNALCVGFDRADGGSFPALQTIEFDSPMFVEVFKVQGTGSAALLTHTSRGTLTDNGVGDYTIALRQPLDNSSALVFGTVLGTTPGIVCPSSLGPKNIGVKTYDISGAPADFDFHLFIFCTVGKNLFGAARTPGEATFRSPRILFMQVDVAAGTPVLTSAPSGTQIADTGVGIFTLTYGRAFKREAYVLMSNSFGSVESPTASGCIVRTTTSTGVPFDTSGPVWLMVLGFDDANQYW
jgi:hypothetical protein